MTGQSRFVIQVSMAPCKGQKECQELAVFQFQGVQRVNSF